MSQKFLIIYTSITNWKLWIWKRNSLFNLVNQQLDIDKIHLFAKYPYEAKYQLLIDKWESTGLT